MEYKNLISDFAKRTLDNYNEYQGDYEITQLINSSLGLFIFPEQKFFNRITDDIVSKELLQKLKKNCNNSYPESVDLKNICKHIRNGIAHYNIRFSSKNTQIDKIEIKDIKNIPTKDGKGTHTYMFTITLTIDLLKEFYISFSNNIINTRSDKSAKS